MSILYNYWMISQYTLKNISRTFAYRGQACPTTVYSRISVQLTCPYIQQIFLWSGSAGSNLEGYSRCWFKWIVQVKHRHYYRTPAYFANHRIPMWKIMCIWTNTWQRPRRHMPSTCEFNAGRLPRNRVRSQHCRSNLNQTPVLDLDPILDPILDHLLTIWIRTVSILLLNVETTAKQCRTLNDFRHHLTPLRVPWKWRMTFHLRLKPSPFTLRRQPSGVNIYPRQ